ncbi:TonB-dependent receptor plug domain-containing protein [Rhizorhabdus dicambivorans]|uniref:TonB-dependent receptor n=1 Tax=Rhizorhabdus dicambivorans TaxID=1850238 RepID=A0A2A4FYU3_9SPHN|nr:TonB-dependent receptor [Rhizorhabdus dicambivorans]ATE67137.1 TonB-dependent receptor [Rhizorhabdus dicambivorans]PCE42877.1 TonB-dependent receptor [Rhizorhabdus dicambivorans]
MFNARRAALAAGAVWLLSGPVAAQEMTISTPAEPQAEIEEGDTIIVQATRSGRRVQDEPVRVEVLGREEIEEKILMRPGNIATILSETGGLRVQVTAPALGASNIRVQGMDGRYTQLLADGLPLYGGQASSLGLLQIAPTDLGQVEVIKGAASALYGPSALGGVINLVSRRPRSEPEAELLLNATTRDGQDATAYLAAPLSEGWGASLTAGVHRQRRQDIDGDGWIDLPGYPRWTARPRLFWDGAAGASAYLTLGAMGERRRGGTLPGRTVADGTGFPQAQRTARFDGGLVVKLPAGALGTAQFRASGMAQRHRHLFGPVREDDRHGTAFAEASLAGSAGGTSWVGGIAWQLDRFRSDDLPAFDYSYRVPGLFAQAEQELGSGLTLAGSGRLDVHNIYGTHVSPRLSLLYRPGAWTIRASGGRGFYAPTPFVEEIEAAGLSRLEPLAGLRAETATTGSLDIGHARGPFEVNMTLFASDMRGSTRLEPFGIGPSGQPERVRLANVAGTTRIRGSELLLRYRRHGFTVTGSYVYVRATEPDGGGGRRAVPLIPRHSAGLVGMWEAHGKGRIGVEAYYTGRQALEDNPYRTRSRPYVELGLLGEIAVGPARLFLNAENILDTRQTRHDPLVRPGRAVDGRWTVDAWGPIEGFTLNGGVRLKL